VLVLEQLFHHVERLALRDLQKLPPQRGARQQRVAFRLRQRLGVAFRDENLRRDGFGLAVPFAERLRVALRQTGDVADRLLQIAAEHQRSAVAMRLAELIARRDVGDALVEAEIPEPRRLADVEMVDGMQVVIEAGLRHFFSGKSAAIGESALHQQDVEPLLGQVGAEDQPVMARADDDAVVIALEVLRQGSPLLSASQ
jgi:hypothetical protein